MKTQLSSVAAVAAIAASSCAADLPLPAADGPLKPSDDSRRPFSISGTTAVLPATQLVEERNINEISKPVHGFVRAHGKGARCGQGVIVYASYGGGSWPAGAGSPYEWDGVETPAAGEPGYSVDAINRHWKLIRRVQVNEVTGPGGIHGAKDVNEPVWVTGWDHRSVVLMVRDHQTGWHTYRLPKGSHTHGSNTGWYKEWPRIRDVGLGAGRLLMNENGMMYHFPATFAPGRTGGLRPISTFLKMIVDYADWNGRVVMGCNDCSAMGNRLYGRVNSNLMFVEKDGLTSYGQRPSGFGGVWCDEPVKGGQPSDPFLIEGFARRTLHLRHSADRDVAFTLEIDADGRDQWTTCKTLTVPAHAYRYEIIPADVKAGWMRLRTDVDTPGASAFFHLENEKYARDPGLVQGLARAGFAGARSDGVIRTHPGERFPLGFAAHTIGPDGTAVDAGYYRVSADMAFERAEDPEDEAALRKAKPTLDFEVDRASVIVRQGGQRFRLPRGAAAFDQAGPTGWFRGRREVVTERDLMNIRGTFYEVPRGDAGGLRRMRPVTTHNLGIYDFCSWRGLLVCSGVNADPAQLGPHCRAAGDGRTALWFGNVDDLWRMGPPAGQGGPWLETAVQAGETSDPYLTFGYLDKALTLWHDASSDVHVTLEVDFQADDTWSTYATLTVPAGQKLTHHFPTGYSAHWIRLKVDRACKVSARFDYGAGDQILTHIPAEYSPASGHWDFARPGVPVMGKSEGEGPE